MSFATDIPSADTRARRFRPLAALWSGLQAVRLANPRFAALSRLGQVSDETLAARGTTREIEVRRILGPAMWL